MRLADMASRLPWLTFWMTVCIVYILIITGFLQHRLTDRVSHMPVCLAVAVRAVHSHYGGFVDAARTH